MSVENLSSRRSSDWMKVLAGSAGLVGGVALASFAVVHATPVPIARFVRALFKDPVYALPAYGVVDGESVLIEANLTYPSSFPQNTVDFYRPRDVRPRATVLWVHGGSFVGGDKGDVVNFASALAQQGYNVFVMNYALAPETTYPAPVVQVGECIDFLLAHADRYDIDFNAFCLAGDSAGAQIAGQYAAIETNPHFAEQMGIERRLGPDGIKVMLLYCGPYNLMELAGVEDPALSFFFDQVGWAYLGRRDWRDGAALEQASLAQQVSEQFPPTYITDGNTGSFESQARVLFSALEAKGVPAASRFFDRDKQVTHHEYQFLLNEDAALVALGDTLSFLETWVAHRPDMANGRHNLS